MEPFIAKYQPKNLELWKSGKDIQPHPDDSKEIKEVWKFCNEILEKSVDEISVNKLGEDIEMFEISKTATKDESKTEEPTELTEEEKAQILKKYCRKQLDHFKHFREILPQINEIVKFDGDVSMTEIDLNDTIENKENIETPFVEQKPVKVNKQILKRAERCNVQIKKSRSVMKDYIDRLPKKTEQKSPKKSPLSKKASSTEVVKKHGFADLTEAEIAAKRSMKKCWFKHKLWPCQKCSGCVRPDCEKCPFCKDKPKYGGRGIMKQKCQFKKCSNPVVRGCDRCTWNL